MHDIYDPPPAPEQEVAPSRHEPLIFTSGDLICLIGVCAVLFLLSITAWRSEPMLALATAGAGSLVVLESWLTALGYLHRARTLRLRARWMVFLAALVPWVLGLGVVVTLMVSLFFISDLVS
jgi:hypothetical protein